VSVTHYREPEAGANIVTACGTPPNKRMTISSDGKKTTCLRCATSYRYRIAWLGMTYEQARKHSAYNQTHRFVSGDR
jgi:hypothetical protein